MLSSGRVQPLAGAVGARKHQGPEKPGGISGILPPAGPCPSSTLSCPAGSRARETRRHLRNSPTCWTLPIQHVVMSCGIKGPRSQAVSREFSHLLDLARPARCHILRDQGSREHGSTEGMDIPALQELSNGASCSENVTWGMGGRRPSGGHLSTTPATAPAGLTPPHPSPPCRFSTICANFNISFFFF